VKFLSSIMLLVFVSGAFGQSNSSFYVSKTGDDSNPGTQTAPWRTIQHGADTVRAGSTVNLIYHCHTAGVSIGGYAPERGRTEHSTVVNDTLYDNDTSGTGSGEFQMQSELSNPRSIRH
jgi:hypothetical protein